MDPNAHLLGEFKYIVRNYWAADGTLDHVEVLLPGAPEGVTVHAPSLEVFLSWLAYVIHQGSGGQINPLLVAPAERTIATDAEQRASALDFGAAEQHTRAGVEAAEAEWINLLARLHELLTAHPDARIVEVCGELDVDDDQARALLDDYAKGIREG